MAGIRSWSRLGLQAKIFSFFTLIVVGLVGLLLFFSYQQANQLAETTLDEALRSTRILYENFQGERLEKLSLVNSVVAESPIFRAIVADEEAAYDGVTLLDAAQEMVQGVGSDFIIVTDYQGLVLARTDMPGRGGESLEHRSLIASALEGESVAGVWLEGERLYHAVSIPMIIGPTILGTVTSGYAIDDLLAEEIKRIADSEIVFFAGTGDDVSLAGTTLGSDTEDFRGWFAASEMVDEASDLRPSLGREIYHAILLPLETHGGDNVGFFTALRSRDRELAGFRAFQRSVLLIGGAGLLLAIGASLLVSRGITGPIKRLVTVTDRIREGDYDSRVAAESDDEIGSLARSFRSLLDELREKQLMEKYISKSAAEMLQRSGENRGHVVERKTVTVLMSDLRAFTALGDGAKPDEIVTGINEALSREAELVERFGGQVDRFVADRMMAVFRGGDMVWSALGCAHAIQHELDDAGPAARARRPSIGISHGEAVFGNVGSSDRLDYTLLGATVHIAGRLCDEALAGDVLLSDEAFQSVADRVAAEPLQPLKIHGLDESLPVFLLSAGSLRQRPATEARMGSGTLRAPVSEATGAVPAVSDQPAEAVPLSAIKPGFVIRNRFKITRVLGSGGMGMVFQAHDRELDEPVALKVLRAEILAVPDMLERFKREIKLARRIAHRNVVRTFDFGEENGLNFITMEYVQGITLKQLIQSKGALPVSVGLRIGKQTCAGLIAAHEQGIVHRDVKPENIILTPTSEAKIMDFGIARPYGMGGTEVHSVTTTGVSLGTPDYMSPEQAQGKQDLDHRSDIYSVGVVLYELFTGVLPFTGDTPVAVALKHIRDTAVPPRDVRPELPPELEAIIVTCLNKSPAQRFPDMASVLTQLAHVAADPDADRADHPAA